MIREHHLAPLAAQERPWLQRLYQKLDKDRVRIEKAMLCADDVTRCVLEKQSRNLFETMARVIALHGEMQMNESWDAWWHSMQLRGKALIELEE